MNHGYWTEFLTIAVAHALAVASPGPDFALVLRQSLTHGRRTAIWSSLGIGCGISVHITYCLIGLGYVLKGSPVLLTTMKFLGAGYLAWLGWHAVRTPPRHGDIDLAGGSSPTSRAAWLTGFLVNVTNPKAALFFIALFPLAVSVHTPKVIQAGYGLWMAVATAAWFCFVSLVFTRVEVRARFLRHGHWIDRALGVVFFGFGVGLVFARLG
ncbi:MAG TPA: LysE family translocator [Lacunisphaera sp.]|jgi:RhtB (resistance to homoserine/threonine) family protein|nr:LysE family translocator [Lacunisphaera sp.]